MFWGFGLMNQISLALSVIARPGSTAEIVAVVDRNPARKGKRVGDILLSNETAGPWFKGDKPITQLPSEVADLVVQDPEDVERVISETNPDVCFLATRAFVREIADPLKVCIKHKVDVMSIAEDLLFPWECDAPELAKEIEESAVAAGVRILGTGYNDSGWILPVQTLGGLMINMTRIEASIAWDCRDYGRAVSEYVGVGLTPAIFQTTIVEPSESSPSVDSPAVHSIVRMLNLTSIPGTVRHQFSPILAQSRVYSAALDTWVEPGHLKGSSLRCVIDTEEGVEVSVMSIGYIFDEEGSKEEEAEDMVATAWGDVPETMVMRGRDVKGRILTCSPMVNRLPQLLAAAPGWVTPDMLAPPVYLGKGLPKVVVDGAGVRRVAGN